MFKLDCVFNIQAQLKDKPNMSTFLKIEAEVQYNIWVSNLLTNKPLQYLY